MDEGRTLPHATRWETLGAWLRVWTPPRDTYVPPVPSRRRLATVAVAAGVPLAIAAALAIGAIDRGKARGAAHDRRVQAALVARERARLGLDQAPHRGSGRPLPRAAPTARLLAARAALVGDLERSITADTLLRFRHGTLSRRVLSTSCMPFVRPSVPNPPQPPPGAREGKYECLAETGSLRVGTPQESVVTGYPVWARVDFRSSRFVWCKVNRRPGEHAAGRELAFVPLAPECDLLRH